MHPLIFSSLLFILEIFKLFQIKYFLFSLALIFPFKYVCKKKTLQLFLILMFSFRIKKKLAYKCKQEMGNCKQNSEHLSQN